MSTAAPAVEKPAATTTTTPATEAPAARSAEDEAAEDAAFGAGFATEHGDKPRVESRPAEPAKPVEPAKATPPAKAEPAKPVEKIVFGGMTEAQVLAKFAEVEDLKKTIAANHDKAFGRFGELQAALKAVSQSPSGQPVKVTKELLKRLNEAGYGELAEVLAEDLNGLVLAAGNGGIDKAAFDKAVDDKVAAATDTLNRETSKKLLGLAHKDWRQVYASDDFKTWKKTLPPEAQTVLDTSWDSAVLTDALDDFKAWQAKAATAATAAKAAEDAAKNQDKRLEGAIPVKTDGKPPTGPSEDEAFERGFAGARSSG